MSEEGKIYAVTIKNNKERGNNNWNDCWIMTRFLIDSYLMHNIFTQNTIKRIFFSTFKIDLCAFFSFLLNYKLLLLNTVSINSLRYFYFHFFFARENNKRKEKLESTSLNFKRFYQRKYATSV